MSQEPKTCVARNSGRLQYASRRRRRAADQVVDVAVQDEQAGGAGEVQVGQLARPGGIPGRQLRGRERPVRGCGFSAAWQDVLRGHGLRHGTWDRLSAQLCFASLRAGRAQFLGRFGDLGRLRRHQAHLHLEFAQGLVGHGLLHRLLALDVRHALARTGRRPRGPWPG